MLDEDGDNHHVDDNIEYYDGEDGSQEGHPKHDGVAEKAAIERE